MNIRFLGTGTSTGVPEIGCQCQVCTSTDARDHRLRASILVSTGNKRILIDCSPDFREQMLPLPFLPIDAVLLTHEHYDHVGGIDDLRPFCKTSDLPIYAEENVCTALRQRIPYCFYTHKYKGVPNIVLRSIGTEPFTIEGITITPIRVLHGKLPIVGYRIGAMAYITDALTIPSEEYAKLQGLDTLIVNALRPEPHPSHQTLSDALNLIATLRPNRAYLTHMSHHFGLHHAIQATLPENVFIAYDTLEI